MAEKELEWRNGWTDKLVSELCLCVHAYSVAKGKHEIELDQDKQTSNERHQT